MNSGFATHEGRTLQLDSNMVEFYNKGQVRQSLRQVYCSVDSVALAQALCEAEPQIRELPQEYVKMRPRPDSPPPWQVVPSSPSAKEAKGRAAKGKAKLPSHRRPPRSKRHRRR